MSYCQEHSLNHFDGCIDCVRTELKSQTLRADAAVGDANEAERKLAEREEHLQDAVDMLAEAAALLPKFGGHKMAKRLEAWRTFFPAFIERIGYEAKSARGKSIVAKPESSAPVERDKHQEFEQACREAALAKGRELDPKAFERRPDGTHVNPLVECGWWGWQAHAALERKPEAK